MDVGALVHIAAARVYGAAWVTARGGDADMTVRGVIQGRPDGQPRSWNVLWEPENVAVAFSSRKLMPVVAEVNWPGGPPAPAAAPAAGVVVPVNLGPVDERVSEEDDDENDDDDGAAAGVGGGDYLARNGLNWTAAAAPAAENRPMGPAITAHVY
jgi:hypothetical protein